ncbi:hypothetical protein CHS0354_039953 [Potamilus streckersoni]|uniref:Uncharacterized protein n=1 Tax=Potamilus streckersoni TaxID=2493646 RepID=A0AAE0W5F6_9BIVA|nr:hypothetical protein CHS0354_039953 [Potamilus streckersoni]
MLSLDALNCGNHIASELSISIGGYVVTRSPDILKLLAIFPRASIESVEETSPAPLPPLSERWMQTLKQVSGELSGVCIQDCLSTDVHFTLGKPCGENCLNRG